MSGALGAAEGERTGTRLGYRSGYHGRTLITRAGKLELRVPQDRDGRFSTEPFERHRRSEQALVAGLAETYAQGVSTRGAKAVAEEPCGHASSASAISAVNKRLDEGLAASAGRLEEPFAYLVLDARCERGREAGVVGSRAVPVAVGIDREGRRRVLAVELANRESRSSRKDLPLGLKERGPSGVEFVVADDRAGPRAASREVLPDAFVRRRHVHFLRNAPDHLPRKADDDCLQELRWIDDRRELAEADPAARLERWSPRHDRLTVWAEQNVEETFTCYRLPRQHHKHTRSTSMLARLNEAIKRRAHVVRIFPDAESCLRLVRALAVEAHENWPEANRHPTMGDLGERNEPRLREAARPGPPAPGSPPIRRA
jgi:transposase-like protein